MISIDQLLTAKERLPHREAQLEGVRQLVADLDLSRGRVIPKVFALFDEVGVGKTKQVVDAAQIKYLQGHIDTVVVVTIDQARSTWADEDEMLGEVAKHAWVDVPNVIHEFHKHYRDLDFEAPALHWVVTNFSYIRRDEHQKHLIRLLKGRKVWIVVDESWSIKGFSQQMMACRRIRVRCAAYATILNGTPLSDGKPVDLFYQLGFLDPNIIGIFSKKKFIERYCEVTEDKDTKRTTITGYKNQDELNKKIAPYTLSRKTRDCWDLPPMLPPITLEARLSPENWEIYKEMRNNLVVWLGQEVTVAKQAIVKILRLAQITSGYLGGLEDVAATAAPPVGKQPAIDFGPPPPHILAGAQRPHADGTAKPILAGRTATVLPGSLGAREIGREKLDVYLDWLSSMQPPPHKLLTWCRFRAELERTTRELSAYFPVVRQLKGGQTDEERELAKKLLAPNGDPQRGAVVGNQKAGGASLNFAAANIAVYLSNGPALLERTQSIGRIERPGAKAPMTVVDIVATGPKGQKTVDHAILKALRKKDDTARWTVNQWREILKAT